MNYFVPFLLRLSTKEEAPAATLHSAFEQVQKELWRKTEAAIHEGRKCRLFCSSVSMKTLHLWIQKKCRVTSNCV